MDEEYSFSRRSFLQLICAVLAALGFGDIAQAWGVAPPPPRAEKLPQKEKHIFLTNELIAGTSHIPEIELISRTLHEGSVVTLQRQYDNLYDKYATRVLNERGERIGFLPQKSNRLIARLIDGGKTFHGEIVSMEWKGYWLCMTMNVFMDEKINEG